MLVVTGVSLGDVGFAFGKRRKLLITQSNNLIRSPYEPGGREFESLRARHVFGSLQRARR